MKTLGHIFILFILGICSFSFNSYAQISPYTTDAVKYTQTDGGGTARFVALGGANVSLGGDISSISGNPAGLGFYNKSSWAISPVLRIGDFSALYQGESTQNMTGNIQIPNMGMVFIIDLRNMQTLNGFREHLVLLLIKNKAFIII